MMMGTKLEEMALLQKGQGCLAKAADGEMIFILRSQDKHYTTLVTIWADEVQAERGADHPKVVEARDNVSRAREWQAQNFTKVPD
jgi:hypothetical protein